MAMSKIECPPLNRVNGNDSGGLTGDDLFRLLKTFVRNSIRTYIGKEPWNANDFRVAIFGDSNSGKSTLLNALLTAFQQDPERFKLVFFDESRADAAGQFEFIGPMKLLLGELVIKFFDTMGFSALHLGDEEVVELISDLVLGRKKPGQLMSRKYRPLLKLPIDTTFTRLDLVVLVANYKVKAAIASVVQQYLALRELGIRSLVVITHVPAAEERNVSLLPELENVPHCCIDSCAATTMSEEQRMQALRVLANIVKCCESLDVRVVSPDIWRRIVWAYHDVCTWLLGLLPPVSLPTTPLLLVLLVLLVLWLAYKAFWL